MFDLPTFDDAFSNYPAAQFLMSDVRIAARAAKATAFEEKLAELVSSPDRDIRSNIDHVPLALQLYFSRVSANYTSEPINYSALLSRIMQRRIQVGFATLNYDTLLELSAAKFARRDWSRHGFAYVADDWKWFIAKLHGSIDWGYPWYPLNGFQDSLEAITRDGPPERGRALVKIGVHTSMRDDREKRAYYPALALPVAGKYGFLCSHQMELRLGEFVRGCTNYLFIGFSGHDQDVLDFLHTNVAEGATSNVEIVALDDADDIRKSLVANVKSFKTASDANMIGLRRGGFRKFLEEDADRFLDRVAAGG